MYVNRQSWHSYCALWRAETRHKIQDMSPSHLESGVCSLLPAAVRPLSEAVTSSDSRADPRLQLRYGDGGRYLSMWFANSHYELDSLSVRGDGGENDMSVQTRTHTCSPSDIDSGEVSCRSSRVLDTATISPWSQGLAGWCINGIYTEQCMLASTPREAMNR